MLDKLRRYSFCVASIAVGLFTPGRGAAQPGPVPRFYSRSSRDSVKLSSAPLPHGRIIFDSDRSGRFAIYSMNCDGSDQHRLVSSEQHAMFPDASPLGGQVVFAQASGLERSAHSDIYLTDEHGAGVRLLAADGTFPTFDSAGQRVFFERNRRLVMAVEIASGREEEIYPRGDLAFDGFEIAKPRLSADGRYLYFISDRGGRWNVWGVDLTAGRSFWVGKGCEPAPDAAGTEVIWVKKRSFLGRTSLARKDTAAGRGDWLNDLGPELGFKYFPSRVPGHPYLLFSSGYGTEWAHASARYQIFLKQLETGECWQLTADDSVNRWARFLPGVRS